MKLTCVTLTGADESVDPKDLVRLSEEFPWVEWGILLMRSVVAHQPRFPGRHWLQRLDHEAKAYPQLRLAGHLCGGWVDDWVCKGTNKMALERPELIDLFDRLQLNFHAYAHPLHEGFLDDLKNFTGCSSVQEVIFQCDGVNNGHLEKALAKGIPAVPLFDLSHGSGRLPEQWPAPLEGVLRNGYAGGLSPANLEEQLKRIDAVTQSWVWVDAESYVRSDYDHTFDLGLVRDFLEVTRPWVESAFAIN